MALIYQAELRPTKLELVSGWAPSQPWFAGDASTAPHSVGAYRFDDPEGEVGVETLLVRHGDGPTLQLPLTYRGVPLADADEWLIGTMQHSVLGTRWVYDGAGDPVYLQTLASVIVGGLTVVALMATAGILANEPIYYGLLASLAAYVVVSLLTRPTDEAVLAAWRERLAGRTPELPSEPVPVQQ